LTHNGLCAIHVAREVPYVYQKSTFMIILEAMSCSLSSDVTRVNVGGFIGLL